MTKSNSLKRWKWLKKVPLKTNLCMHCVSHKIRSWTKSDFIWTSVWYNEHIVDIKRHFNQIWFWILTFCHAIYRDTLTMSNLWINWSTITKPPRNNFGADLRTLWSCEELSSIDYNIKCTRCYHLLITIVMLTFVYPSILVRQPIRSQRMIVSLSFMEILPCIENWNTGCLSNNKLD